MYGIVTPTGLALHHNGRSVPLPVTSVTPMAVDVAAASSALIPCRWCSEVGGCDCLDWMEFMLLDAPTHLEDEPDEPTQDTTPTPLFTWSDGTIGGHLDSDGKLYWNWSQSETDWIRTGC